MANAGEGEKGQDQLADALANLFNNVAVMVRGDLQGMSSSLELLEKMNLRFTEEYQGFEDIASGLRHFVEQLSDKNKGFETYVQKIELIDRQVTEFEAAVSMLARYVSLLESRVKSACQRPPV
ncbi:biogenesis of lysosome organelles complex 1 subunit-like protein isoform X1 [Wolffia australiana]